jgi:hypothetical protein
VVNRTQFQQKAPQQQGQYRVQAPRQIQVGNTPMKGNTPNTPNTSNNNRSFVCEEPGHLSYSYPKKVAQGPQGQASSQKTNVHTPSKQGQQNYARGKVNHVSTNSIQEAPTL